MSTLLAATAPAGDGAPIADIALVGGIISAATIALLAVVVAYRAGRAKPLEALSGVTERVVGIPGWAAIPGLATIGAAVVTFMGAIWDIGVHIDKGRDNGPFGTTAHYPLLVGLVLTYLMGILAVGMTPRKRARTSRAGFELPGIGRVPTGALLILAGGGYAMLGFPLDDLWHRIFGQDVTLWGPTHTMFFGGLITAACGAVILMSEGARTIGREPFGRQWWRKPLPGILGGVMLFVATHATDEFNWAVPQYRQIWQPMLLAFFGGLGLVVARRLTGRGGTIAVLAAYLPLQLIEVVMIGALGTTQPASVLFIAEAIVVEAVFWRTRPGTGSVQVGALAGLAVGTLGFGAEYAWSQVGMPLPWHVGLVPEALPATALAGVAAGVLATLMAHAMEGSLPQVRRPLALALGATGLVLALAINAGISTTPSTDATLALSNVRTAKVDGGHGGPTQVADLRVRLSRPDLGKDGNWAYVLAWQGDGRYKADLRREADGTLVSTKPVPIGGTWKSFVRIHKGRVQVAVPVRMPADAALGFAGFPALPQVTRPMQRDTKLLQVERKDDGPLWAWTPAMLLVQLLNLSLMALVAAGCVRLGRRTTGPDADDDGAAPGRAGRRVAAPRAVRRLVGA